MPVIRTYACETCGDVFDYTCESSDPDPQCAGCNIVMEWRPKSFAIGGIKSKALDITQKVMEEQYGYTDFKDHVDPGETVVKAPRPMQTAEHDAIGQQVAEYAEHTLGTPLTPVQKQMASTFWDGGQAAAAQIPVANLLAGARANAAVAAREGRDPMKMLHEMGREGKLKQKIDVVARAKM